MRKETPAPKKRNVKGRYQPLVDSAFEFEGEWVAEDYPNLKDNFRANVYATVYAAIGRKFADVRMQDGTLYVRINSELSEL